MIDGQNQLRQTYRTPRIRGNRIRAAMVHCPRYAFRGVSRLADDAGISRSTVSRLVRGLTEPTFAIVSTVTAELEKASKRRIDPRELVTTNDCFPTRTVCNLMGCKGCLPDDAFDEEASIRQEFKGVKPGTWSGNVVRYGRNDPSNPGDR